MRELWLIVFLVLFGSASTAFAQSACPTEGCPTDVGACLAESCPCSGPSNGPVTTWKNHGQYVKCVVHLRNDLRKAGCLDNEAKRTIAKCAARSTCGKEGFVLCCFYDTTATCSAAGVCSNDDTKACGTATDCITVTGPKLAHDAENCTDRGGTSIGEGSVCGGCPATPPPS